MTGRPGLLSRGINIMCTKPFMQLSVLAITCVCVSWHEYRYRAYFQVPSANEAANCYDNKCFCANDNTIRYLGNTLDHNCNILIEEARFNWRNPHNGTWTCIVNSQFSDTVNVTVTAPTTTTSIPPTTTATGAAWPSAAPTLILVLFASILSLISHYPSIK